MKSLIPLGDGGGILQLFLLFFFILVALLQVNGEISIGGEGDFPFPRFFPRHLIPSFFLCSQPGEDSECRLL